MIATYFDRGQVRCFERDTFDACVTEYYRLRKLRGIDRAGWGHVLIDDGSRIYL